MDLLIEKGTTSVKLSEYGFYNIAIEESAPETIASAFPK